MFSSTQNSDSVKNCELGNVRSVREKDQNASFMASELIHWLALKVLAFAEAELLGTSRRDNRRKEKGKHTSPAGRDSKEVYKEALSITPNNQASYSFHLQGGTPKQQP
jgi:hypothetical protein